MNRLPDMLLRTHRRKVQRKRADIVVNDIKKGYNTVFMEGLTDK